MANISSPVKVTTSELIALNRVSSAFGNRTRRIVARQSGGYNSSLKGRGMEFDESRLYQPGDDIRNMDWRVTARTGKPHSKLFREERERPVFVFADYRAPMFFATRGVYKAVFAARTAALIGWNALQAGDRVGGLVFSETDHHELKPAQGKQAVLHLINRLVDHPAWNGNDQSDAQVEALKKALIRLNRLVRPGSLIYMISDFRGLELVQAEVARLARHCEIILISIHDVLEESLPAIGHYRLSHRRDDLLIDTQQKKQRLSYEQRYQQHQEFLQACCSRYGMHLYSCLTTDDPKKI